MSGLGSWKLAMATLDNFSTRMALVKDYTRFSFLLHFQSYRSVGAYTLYNTSVFSTDSFLKNLSVFV